MSNIKNLLTELNHIKPKGWSVVWRDGAISVRPDNRAVGKFVTYHHRDETYTVGFFCREKNIWTAYNDFPESKDVCSQILQWMKAEYQKTINDGRDL